MRGRPGLSLKAQLKILPSLSRCHRSPRTYGNDGAGLQRSQHVDIGDLQSAGEKRRVAESVFEGHAPKILPQTSQARQVVRKPDGYVDILFGSLADEIGASGRGYEGS